MGYAQRTVPEQPAQPREPHAGIELACKSVYRETYKIEIAKARECVKKILASGSGMLESLDKYDRYVQFDKGQLWAELTRHEESDDLAITLGGHVTDDPLIKIRATALTNHLIEMFVAEHAERMATHAEKLYLISLEAA